ncbi:MAG: MFS transporter [Christensenellales bacterium]|jgi:sugar (glycoside-pentoside-hexuronide) transporter
MSINDRLHKIFGTSPASDLQPKEAISYSIAGLGQNLICALVSSYLVYYMTNGLLISAVTVGFIMLFTRLFDAFNDPIMGSIVDKTRSKYGKCRPYLLYAPIPIALITVLIFLPLTPQSIMSTVIVTTLYVIWSVVYTIVDVPYWGLASSMTSDTLQRGTMLTFARIACTVGGGLIAVVVPNLSSMWIKGFTDSEGNIIAGMEGDAAAALRQNYVWLALVVVLIATPTFFIGFKYTKERFYSDDKPASFLHNLGLLFKNKPLLIIIISGVLGSAKMLYIYSGIYFAQYNLANIEFMGMEGIGLFTLITFSQAPGGFLASVITPYCSKKFGKKKTFIWSHIAGAVMLFIMFMVGWDQPWKLMFNLIGLVLVGIPGGFANIMTYAMIADSIDYLEYKTGERGEGICFAMQTFINKISMAAGAAVTCFGLGWAHISASDISTVTRQGQNVLFTVTVLIPAISMLLTAIPLFFYKFNEKEQAEAVKITAARKAKLSENISAD